MDSSNHPYDGNGTDEEHLLEDDTRVYDENEVNFVEKNVNVLNNMKTYVMYIQYPIQNCQFAPEMTPKITFSPKKCCLLLYVLVYTHLS